jgi:hypothetical protein
MTWDCRLYFITINSYFSKHFFKWSIFDEVPANKFGYHYQHNEHNQGLSLETCSFKLKQR